MKLIYRPEIDGLRAIAVGAVIIYHAKVTILGDQLFKGGFIGVDIFFVISGYLITSIILKELIAKGSFNFKHFYERRVRRILPVLLSVIIVSLPFAWIYLLPGSLIDFSKSILYSLGFSSNFYFYYLGHQYGDAPGLLKPFLHTWSLSVEEQFYIFFPIFLLITFKYFRKYLIHILILGFVVSLAMADWGSKNHPLFSFYLLPTRIWELLAGSILAYFEIIRGYRSKNKTLNSILPLIGLLLILYSILFFNHAIFHPSFNHEIFHPSFNHAIFHPSFNTLFPIIGVCLVIWFSNKNELITKILSNKLFVGIGLISYSLYLWHYPIFAFLRATQITEGNLLYQLIAAIFLIALSIISYYIIEKPARNTKVKFKIIVIIILISTFFLVSVNLNFILKDGYKSRFYYTKNYQLEKKIYRNENLDFIKNYNYTNFDDRKNAFIIGNSHAQDILKILSNTYFVDKIYFYAPFAIVREKFMPFQLKIFYDFLKKKDKEIINIWSKNFLNLLKKQYNNSDIIIISSQYQWKDFNFLDDLIKILKEDKKKIIILDNALNQEVKARFNRLDFFVYKYKEFPDKNNLREIEKKMFLDLNNKKQINNQIELIARKNNVFLIKRKEIFCNSEERRCPAVTNRGDKIYYDYGHITNKDAEFFAKKIQKNQTFIKYLNLNPIIKLN